MVENILIFSSNLHCSFEKYVYINGTFPLTIPFLMKQLYYFSHVFFSTWKNRLLLSLVIHVFHGNYGTGVLGVYLTYSYNVNMYFRVCVCNI